MQMEQLVVVKLAISLIAILVFLLWERLIPSDNPPVALLSNWKERLSRYARNIGLWVINAVLSPLVIVPVSLFFALHALHWRDDFNWIWLDIALLDLWIYWWHRANHRIPFLWRFHQVHHLDRWLDVTTAFRFHFGEVLLSALVRGVYIWVMGIQWQSVLLFESLVLICATFHHSNSRLPVSLEKPLSMFIITPSIHWIHHHAVKADTDSNYGTILSLWDRLFFSLSRTIRSPQMTLGLEGENDRRLPSLLYLPLQKSATE